MRLSQLKPDRRAQLTIRNQGRVAETASRCFEFKKRSQLFIGDAHDFEDYPIILTAGQITITGFRARVHGQAVGQSCGAQAVDRAVASTSRTTGVRYIYESQEGRIMLILWKLTQGKPPG